MGHSLAITFAMGGHEVILHVDVSSSALRTARSLIVSSLNVLEEVGLCTPKRKENILNRSITFTDNLGKYPHAESSLKQSLKAET